MDEEEPNILRSEVELAMKKMRNDKAPGCDDIPAELFKESGEEGVSVMHGLCNLIWKVKTWPQDWTDQYSCRSQRKVTHENVKITEPSL